MSYEEERIVKMTFDNTQFTKDVEATIAQLEKLEKSMNIKGSSTNAFTTLARSADSARPSIDSYANSIDTVTAKFSKLQIIGATVLSELTKAALSAGKKLYDSTLGQILSGGSRRALNLENARFKIEGLEGDWDQLYKSMDYAVSGTAYGLDQAANVAAQLLASGISYERVLEGSNEQLSLMDTALRGVSGVAAMTGRSYDDVGHIFTTVAGNGRLFAMQLNQISAYGLNAAKALADYYNEIEGVSDYTEAKIREMVSQGKVSFADFAQAMDSAFGEHAKDANKTFTGALDNMKAALSRTGEKFLTPFHEFERNLYNIIRPLINVLNKQLGPVVGLWTAVLDRMTEFITLLGQNEDFVYALQYALIDVEKVIINIAQALYEVTGFRFPNIYELSLALKNFFHDLQLNEETGKRFRDIIKSIIGVLQIAFTLIKAIAIIIEPFLITTVRWLGQLFGIQADSYDALYRMAPMISNIILTVARFIAMKVPDVLRSIVAGIKVVINALKYLSIGFAIVIGVLIDIGNIIKNVIVKLLEFKDVAIAVFSILYAGFLGLGTLIVSLYGSISSFTSGIFGGMSDAITGMVAPIVATQQTVIDQQREYTEAVEETTEAIEDMSDAQEEYTGKHAISPDDYGKGARHPDNAPSDEPSYGELVSAQTDADVQMLSKAIEKEKKEIDAYDHAQAEMARRSEENKKILHGMLTKSPFEAFTDRLSKFADEFKDKFTAATDKVKDFFSNKARVILTSVFAVGIAVIGSVIASVIGILTGLGTMFIGAGVSLIGSGIGNIALGIATIFESLVPVFLSYAALIGVIAIVDRFADLDRVYEFLDSMTTLCLRIMRVIAVVAIFFAIRSIVVNAAKAISDIRNILGRNFLKPAPKSLLENVTSTLLAITAVVAVMATSIYTLGQMDLPSLLKGFIFTTLIFGSIITAIILMSRLMQTTMDVETTVQGNILAGGMFKKKTTSVFSGLTEVLITMALLMGTLTLSIAALSYIYNKDADAFKKAKGVITGFTFLILAIMAALGTYSYFLSKSDKLDTGAQRAINGQIKRISDVIKSIALSLLLMSAAMLIISAIDPDKFWYSAGAVAGLFLVTGAAIGLILNALNPSKDSKSPLRLSGNKDKAEIDMLSERISFVSELIKTIGKTLLALVAAIAILSILPTSNMLISFASLSVFIIVMGVAITQFIKALTKFNASTSSTNANHLVDEMAKINEIISAIGNTALKFAASMAIMSLIPIPNLIAGFFAMNLSMGVMSGIVVWLMNSVAKFSAGSLVGDTSKLPKDARRGGKKSGNVKKVQPQQMTSSINNVIEIINTISKAMLLLSAALFIAGAVDPINMLVAAGSLVSMMAIMSLIVVGITSYIEKNNVSDDTVKSVQKLMMSIAGVVLAISAGFLILGAVDWNNIGSSVGYLMGAFGLVLGILAISVLIAKFGGNAKSILASAAVMGTISILLFAVGQLFLDMNKVDWNNLSAGLPIIITTFAGVVGILTAIDVMVGVGKLPTILSASLVVATIAGLLLVMGKFANDLNAVDWSSVSSSMPILITIFAGLTAIILAAGIIGAISPIGLVAASGIILMMIPLVLAIGAIVKIMSTIDNIDKANETVEILIKVFATLAIFMAVMGVIGTFLPMALLAVAALDSLFLSIAAAFAVAGVVVVLISAAATKLLEALTSFMIFFNEFINMDWSNALIAGQNLAEFIRMLVPPFIEIFAGIPGMLALAISLPLLAISLAALSNVSPEQISSIATAIDMLVNSLMIIVTSNADLTPIISFALQLTIAAGLLTVGALVMTVAVVLIQTVAFLMSSAFTAFMSAIVMVIDGLNNLGIFDQMSNLNAVAVSILVFGTLLTIGSALLLAGSVVMLVGSAILLGAAAVMSKAIELLTTAFTTDKMSDLNAIAVSFMIFAVLLGAASGLLSLGSIGFIIASTLFLAGSALFMQASAIFERGVDNICDASDRVCESVRNIADTFQYTVQTISDTADDMAEAGGHVVEGLVSSLTGASTVRRIWDSGVEMARNVINSFRDEADINSPSRVFAELGMYLVAGLLQGLEEGEPLAQAWTHQYVDETGETLEEGFGKAGRSGIYGLLDAIKSSFNSSGLLGVLQTLAEKAGLTFSNAFGGSMTGGIGSVFDMITRAIAQQKSKISAGDHALQALYGEREKYLDLQARYAEVGRSLSKEQAQKLADVNKTIARYEGQMQGMESMSGFLDIVSSISKTFEDADLGKLDFGGGGGGSYGTYTPVDVGTSYSGVGGGSTAGLAADTGNLVGNTITTNNTYNFTQNNYSPEPIDRTELYTQTNNQLNSWYKWLRSQ